MRRRELTRLGLASLVLPLAGVGQSSSLAADRQVPLPDLRAALGAPVEGAYFGMHFHRLFGEPSADRVRTVWPAATVGAVRLWDSTTRWGDLAPARGRWDFRRLDASVALAEAQGASVLYTLGSTPRWASARPEEPGPYGPGCAAEPVSMADWHDYVRRVAERYGDRIAAYEVWNEPYFSDFEADRQSPAFFTGSVAQLIDMARLARQALDAAAPRAILASPGFVGGSQRIDRYLGAGGARFVQAMAYHFYCTSTDEFVADAARLRRLMGSHGLERVPLWNTECGIVDPAVQPRAVGAAATGGAALLAQFLLLAAASGIDRFYYHAWDNDLTGLVDRSGAHRALRPAYERAREWLLGWRIGAPTSLGAGVTRIDAERAGERRVFAWSAGEREILLPIAPGWSVAAIESLSGAAVAPRTSADRSLALRLTAAPQCVRIVGDRAT